MNFIHRDLTHGTRTRRGLHGFIGISAVLLFWASILAGQTPSEGTITRDTPVRRADHVRQLNDKVLRAHDFFQENDKRGAQAFRADAAEMLRARAAELGALIQEDSSQALLLAFSPELVQELAVQFPESASLLEAHGSWQGRIESWAMDYYDGSHRTVHLMHAGAETLEIHFASAEPADLKAGTNLSVTGVRLGSLVVAADAFQPSAAQDLKIDDTTAMAATATVCCSTTGVQNIAVFLITFPGITPPSYLTAQNVYASYFGTAGRSLDGYWREASYGKTSASGNVFGWFTLSTSYGCTTNNDFSAMQSETFAQAAAAGVNLQNYTAFHFVAPDFACGWSGLASMGSTTMNSINAYWGYINGLNWKNNDGTAVQVIMHESGHNLGLNHSNSRAFGSEALGSIGAAGVVGEYGDGFSAMSNGGVGHYTAPHKANILHWLPNYQVVQTGGTYIIQPLELTTGGLQALKIQRGTGNNAWLWVEYRQPIGNYDNAYVYDPQWFAWGNQIFSGAVIHYEDALTTSNHSDLLDFTPTSDWGFYDPALAAGQTWFDPYSNLSITVQSATASGLTLSIGYGGSAPCTHTNPGISISPANPSVFAGSSVTYTVSVTNKDSSACPATTFTLASTQPIGWLGGLSAAALTLNPGQTASVTLTETVSPTATAGTYAIGSSAASGSYTSSATANATVVTPATSTPVLTDVTSVSSSTYSVRQTVLVTATVKKDGAAAAAASVIFTLTKSNGVRVTGKATTDSAGRAIWSYRIGAKDPAGSYSVMNNATYQSTTVTSNSVVFEVH